MLIRFCVFIFVYLFFHQGNAYAFFTDDYKKRISYGAFKKAYSADVYIGVKAGFIVRTWAPNIITTISPNFDAVSEYLSKIPNSLADKSSGKYSYSVGVDIGLHTEQSKFRHEINFEWYGITSETINVGTKTATISETDYSYSVLGGKRIITLGNYADIYKLGYSVYYNFENLFSAIGTKWDLFVGFGAGFAYVSGGTYIGSEISDGKNSANEDEEETNNSGKYSYSENDDIAFSTDASEYRLTKAKSFAVAYQGRIGVLANMSQSFAASISLSFGATSRPLFTTKFRSIDKQDGVRSHLEYHIALEIGILLKAFQIAL